MSKRLISKATASVLIGMFATACSKSNSGSISRIDAASIVNSTDTVEVKAENLAKAAEQLLSAQGFAYAGDVANLALEQDPKNLRAKFVKAIVAPFMTQRGIFARIAPLAAKDPQTQESYEKALADVDTKFPNSTLKTFLLDGSPDITTESEAQAQLENLTKGFEVLRKFAKDNKDQRLTVLTTDGLYKPMNERLAQACVIDTSAPWTYDVRCPSPVHALEVTLERADFEAIQTLAAGSELYLSLYNSYDLSGSIDVVQAHSKDQQSTKPQQIVDQLLKNPNFGTLRPGNGFRLIKELGADAVRGLRWVITNQDTLCPIGHESHRNRIGALFDTGICVTGNHSDIAVGLRKAETVLAGGLLPVSVTDAGETTVIRPSALIENPIQNLRSLTPLQFSACDKLSGIADASVNGLFPRQDVNKVLQASSSCH